MIGRDTLDVSRETLSRLDIYVDLLRKWNPKINLVSKASLENIWARHVIDSEQIFHLVRRDIGHWADLGSGGGFPGLVIAILGMEIGSPARMTLVESDVRKSAFLRTVIRETGAPATVVNDRIEKIDSLKADVISARALADLGTLLKYTYQHLVLDGTAIFPKGVTWQKELKDAQSKWKFEYQVDKSETEDGPVILSVTGVASV